MVDSAFFFLTFKYNTNINMLTVGHVCPPVVDSAFFFIVCHVHTKSRMKIVEWKDRCVGGPVGPTEANIK